MKNHVITFSLLLLLSFVPMAIAHEWMAPKNAGKMTSPIPSNQKSIEVGRQLYVNMCAACHGINLEGDKAGQLGLEQDPPNLMTRLKTHSDGDFVWKIKQGKGDMPSFSDDLTDSETWSILHYIKQQ